MSVEFPEPKDYDDIIVTNKNHRNAVFGYAEQILELRFSLGGQYVPMLLDGGCSSADMGAMYDFLKSFRIRNLTTGHKAILALAISEAAPYVKPLYALSLKDVVVNDTTFDEIELAFNRLTANSGLGHTAASKILAVLNPDLFVMWDRDIAKQYCKSKSFTSPDNGFVYRNFLADMAKVARFTAPDHDRERSTNPFSQDARLSETFTLAKLIDNYNWITLVHGKKCRGC